MLRTFQYGSLFFKKVIALEIILEEGKYKFHLIKPFQLSAMVVIIPHNYLLTAPTLEMLPTSLKPHITN